MKRKFIFVLLLLLIIFLPACENDDPEEYNYIFEKYQTELEKEGFILYAINNTNNVSGWLNITDDDVISLHRAQKDSSKDFVYIYQFPSVRKANKWYKNIEKEVEKTNYESILDGPYILVIFGEDLYDAARSLDS